MLSELPVPGRPTDWNYSRAWAYCDCSRCGWGCLDIFSLVYRFLFFLSLWKTVIGWLFWAKRPFETVFQSMSGRLQERVRKKREKIEERKMSKQLPPAWCDGPG